MKIGIAIAVCAAVGFFSYRYLSDRRFVETTDNAYVRGDIVAIASKVSGYVVEISVGDNERVEAGDVLFRIDPVDYEARRAQAVASLRAARAAKESIGEERTLQEALVAEADAGLAAARAEATRAGRDRRRAENLFVDGWTTAQRHDAAVATDTRAGALVQQALAGLAARQQRLAVIDAESSRLDADIEKAAAQLKLAEIALHDTVVRAPVAGVVGNRRVEKGDFARPGVPFLSIVSSDDIWVVANFKETQLEGIVPGLAARVRVDTFPDHEITGRIDSLAPASGAEFSLLPPDNATGNFVRVVQRVPVKIILDPDDVADVALRPGMSAEVWVDRRGRTDKPRAASPFDLARAAITGSRGDETETSR